ncbi:hypothetical protein FA15DRAFT_682711 [Coprinopsis marcescibilis]|uniref:DNA breaking-rejoining enzyme n=1 Tax=Coprinopsis marcescibilis TaxID=230819 RepID=A0A5C3KIN7_COPMA|nr:hypothetical protein FA15DRAFT_682711 [Coprinopsis marcescibilis]
MPITLSKPFSSKLKLALKNRVSNAMSRNYSSSISTFTRFYNKESIPHHLCFPTSEFILCAFATSGTGTLSVSTIRNQLAALHNYHIIHGLEWNGSHHLSYVLSGVDRLSPPSARQPPQLPVNAKMLAELTSALDLHNQFDAAIAACASVAFWGQAQLGKLLKTSAQSLLDLSTLKASSNPHSLLCNHLLINNVQYAHNLFIYKTHFGQRNLTKSRFLDWCNQIWTPLGYPRFTGHSFRIGGTTELLLAGVPPDVVKAMGRWSLDAFLRYWRSLNNFAPLSSIKKQIISLLSSTYSFAHERQAQEHCCVERREK